MSDLRLPVSLAVCLASVGSCTTFNTAVVEFDSVSRIEGSEQWPEEVDYRQDPKRYSWLARQTDGIGSGWLLRNVFEVEPAPTEVDNPSGLARQCVEVMGDKGETDLNTIARATRRLLWVAELDVEHPLNQALALVGIENLMLFLGFDANDMQLPDPEVMTREKVDAWVNTLDQGWPGARQGAPLPEPQRSEYVAALEHLTQLPLVSGRRQRALIGALDKGLELEDDPTLIEPSREALRKALFHGMSLGIRRALSSGSPGVREAGISALHRLGGADSVPKVLELVAKPSSSAARGINRYDEDPFVRLSLVRICGQLDKKRAMQSSGNGPAPVELLYEIFFADPDEGLRTMALQGLAQVLERDVDFEPGWAERWWSDDYVPNRRSLPGQ